MKYETGNFLSCVFRHQRLLEFSRFRIYVVADVNIPIEEY